MTELAEYQRGYAAGFKDGQKQEQRLYTERWIAKRLQVQSYSREPANTEPWIPTLRMTGMTLHLSRKKLAQALANPLDLTTPIIDKWKANALEAMRREQEALHHEFLEKGMEAIRAPKPKSTRRRHRRPFMRVVYTD